MMALILALTQVESGGRLNAVGADGLSYGLLQITDICREDINNLYETSFTRDDCFDQAKSELMCYLYLNHYATKERIGREVTDEDRSRIWNSGPNGWKKECSKKYWVKVEKELKKYETKDVK